MPDPENEQRHIALLIEIPAIYTDDLPGMLADYHDEFGNESEALSNMIGEPHIARVRFEISGEKDSDVQEVWGYVREVQLVEPSRGYEGAEPHLTDAQLEKHGGYKLMRDEDACEWCQYQEPTDA
jgi:hypothetical protein